VEVSLRRRVLLGCAAVALVLFVADVALASTFRRYLLDRVDEQLAETAERIADFASGPLRGRPGRGGPGPGRGPALTEFYVGIAGPDGRLLRRFDTPLRRDRGVPELDPDAVRGAATGPGEPLRPFAADGAHHAGWRVVALQVAGADQIVVVGAGLADVDPTYRRMVGAWSPRPRPSSRRWPRSPGRCCGRGCGRSRR